MIVSRNGRDPLDVQCPGRYPRGPGDAREPQETYSSCTPAWDTAAVTVYRATRNLYQRLFNREHWRHRQAQKALFAQFVKPSSLVFDIGANRGEVSETFLVLGATTVAVEPNPALAASIARHHGRGIHVENVAVGAQPGRADLNLGNDSGHSTLSTEWMERAPSAERWHGTVSTEVTTLDALIEKYGSPDFVKIDVEAYEAEVLAGLTGRLQPCASSTRGHIPKSPSDASCISATNTSTR